VRAERTDSALGWGDQVRTRENLFEDGGPFRRPTEERAALVERFFWSIAMQSATGPNLSLAWGRGIGSTFPSIPHDLVHGQSNLLQRLRRASQATKSSPAAGSATTRA